MGVVLALDDGGQRIGLAVTDQEQRHALAHSVVHAQPAAAALSAMLRVISGERVERIVVGLPLTLAGTEGAAARKARAFGDVLARETGLPVEFVDERFTSRAAERAAAEKGTAPDAEAARLVLEAWLQQRSG